ncbi:DsrE/DsrF-like family protein [bacterium BMS3Abin07]|nr:DsrE/DsrF-like family protein [bacterium BMS3Abin07]GBE32724.1 DsrE/DsrF-like family protein [bacterium BMS3Bbin05]
MKLGILVTTDKYLDEIRGITKAALSLGHEVSIFSMDEGTRLLENPAYTELCKLEGVTLGFCDHNAEGLGINKEGIDNDVLCGSQYDNAVMQHEADKVIVL